MTGEFVKDVDATCTNKTKGHYKATFTKAVFSEQNTENSSVEVGYLGHIDEDGNGECDVCKLKYEYYYYDTQDKEYKKAFAPITEINVIDENTDEFTSGFNIVTESVEFSDRIYLSGDVHIILANNVTLTANDGINVSEGVSLSIYSQSLVDSEMGKIIATGGDDSAGIGSGYKGSGGTVNIYGGTVTATGYFYSAGIGSGYKGSGGTVNIYGGTVTATGGNGGAGIGGGYQGDGGNVYIYGGTVNATGGEYSSGIGGGDSG
ncbi:MAG: hypothetical protein MJ072_07090, partial [Clostridia bacterium]|nr:hypothetical protein [Clostridia bacterium]